MVYEIQSIFEKGFGSKGEEKYLVKRIGSNRKSWVNKSEMNCTQLLFEFERKNGPKILGAKRESGGVVYMVKGNATEKEKFIPSFHTKKFRLSVIDYLHSKIVFDNSGSDHQFQISSTNPLSCDEPSTFVYATKRFDGLFYFYQDCSDKIGMLTADEAIEKYPELVVAYLEKCIA